MSERILTGGIVVSIILSIIIFLRELFLVRGEDFLLLLVLGVPQIILAAFAAVFGIIAAFVWLPAWTQRAQSTVIDCCAIAIVYLIGYAYGLVVPHLANLVKSAFIFEAMRSFSMQLTILFVTVLVFVPVFRAMPEWRGHGTRAIFIIAFLLTGTLFVVEDARAGIAGMTDGEIQRRAENTIDPALCQRITNPFTSQNCINNVLYRAVSGGNPAFCPRFDEIEQVNASNCYRDIAATLNDESICRDAPNTENCLEEVAKRNHRPEVCDLIAQDSMRQVCKTKASA